MGKRRRQRRPRAEQPVAQKPSAPFNNPFGALSDLRDELAPAPVPIPRTEPEPAESAREPTSWGKLVIMCEKKGRAGKTVTRVKGLPPARREEVAQRMRLAFGCGAALEGEDLLLQGSQVERAKEWLEGEGASRVIVSGGAEPSRKARALAATTSPGHGSSSTRCGELRADLERGLTVDVVLKKDQRTGALTRGVIQDILTKSVRHPHGIKVRLADGRVGRVKQIIEA